MRTTMDFYKTQGKKFKPPVLTTKAWNQFLGDDNKIDGVYTATNDNFEAFLCENTKNKIRLDKRSLSLVWDLGQLGTKSWVINDDLTSEKPKRESHLTKIDINKDVD